MEMDDDDCVSVHANDSDLEDQDEQQSLDSAVHHLLSEAPGEDKTTQDLLHSLAQALETPTEVSEDVNSQGS